MEKSVDAETAHPGAATALPQCAAPTTEEEFAEVLADVVRADVSDVSPDAHFFDDLGADSLVMARFCARVRKRAGLPSVSMKDIYAHPTIRRLASALAGPVPEPASVTAAGAPTRAAPESPAPTGTPETTGTPQYVLCGAAQMLFFFGYSYLVALVATRGYGWISTGAGFGGMYLRAVLFGGGGFLILCTLPIVAKWVLIGRWKPGRRIRVWSLGYLRFWVVKTLIRSNPLLLLIGGRSEVSASSPLYVLYLRALGARIGRGVAIFSRNVPVCTDLLTIGDGAVIRKDCFFNCYQAEAGVIRTGPVTVGKGAFVGEATVLDIGTSLGVEAQLAHSSTLHEGQAVPDGERWHGTPAQQAVRQAGVDYGIVEPTRCGALRRAVHGVVQSLAIFAFYMPAVVGGTSLVLSGIPQLNGILLHMAPMGFTNWTFYRDALVFSFVLFFGSILGGLLLVCTVPRVLNRGLKPGKVYPLYGFHYGLHRAIGRMTNVKFFTALFGDSSYIVYYLRGLGYDLSDVEQTGSNFGSVLKHENPFLASVGRGTMIADALSIINADFSSTSFRLSRASIGAHNFLGNAAAYPAQSRTGENCLLATKVMVPIDGEIRENTGLLGSPSFPIPRTVERDGRFDHLKRGEERRRHLSAKNKYNLRTMAWVLLVRWMHLFGITVLLLVAEDIYTFSGSEAIAVEIVVGLLFTMSYFILVERAVARFRPLRPRFCSIYDSYFWRHERYWKMVIPPFDLMLSGTPFKNVLSRLLGVRIGKKVFDDGLFMPERTLVSIGDHATLNMGTTIQCHSQEDGTFKSDRSAIGAGCTLATGSFVHYGVTMEPGSMLAAGSFLMKGEEVPGHERWAGNPARRSFSAEPAIATADQKWTGPR